MDITIAAKIINSVGLSLDIIGSFFVLVEVVKQFKGNEHKPIAERTWGETNPETAEYRKWKKSKYTHMRIGLCCLILGFSLQFASTWTAYFFQNSQTPKHITEKNIKEIPATTAVPVSVTLPNNTANKETTIDATKE